MTRTVRTSHALVALMLIAAIPSPEGRGWAVLALLALDVILDWRAIGRAR